MENLVIIEHILSVCKVFKYAEMAYNLIGVGKMVKVLITYNKPLPLVYVIELKSADADFVWIDLVLM